MKTSADPIAARELALYAENDSRLYHRHALPIIANLARKMKRGQYDPEKAVKAWGYMADEAARQYCREFCERGALYHQVFNAATRREAAAQLEEGYREQVEDEANKEGK